MLGTPPRAWSIVLAVLVLTPSALAMPAPELPGDLDLDLGDDAAGAAAKPAWTFDDRVVVGFAGPAEDMMPVLASLAPPVEGALLRVDATLGFAVFQVEPARQADLMKAALRVPGVTYAKPDARMEGFFTPNDPLYPHQWGPAPMGVPQAWNVTRGDHSRTVAVLDTGVDGTHPDLAANYCVDGPDFINGDNSSMDDHGHGTHVAGTVAAAIDNGVGVAGMADACLMGVKVLSQYGGGSFADLASAIVWAADHGAHVISMSLGGCSGCDPGSPTTEAVQYAHDAGVLVVAAAGNAGCAPVSYPAAYPEVVAVAALTAPGNERASFSSCGDEVELSAPGQNVISTSLAEGPLSHPSGYMNLSGTSMATPHVSGVAALAWSHQPNLTNDDLRCVLAQTAVDLGAAGRDPYTGFGRVDAAAALGASCVPMPPTAVSLDARGRNERVLLEWTAATSWGSNLSGYELFRGETPGNLTLLASLPDVRAYEDLDVANNVTYHYAVRGVNGLGPGGFSNVANATPVPPQPFSCRQANDSFGNACRAAAYNFIDISATGAPLPPADDALFPLELPFAFTFYGNKYARVNVSTNGFLDVADGTDSGCCSGRPIPDGEEPNGLVAGFWADLLPRHERAITTQVLGENGSRVVVVQFTDVPFFWGNEARMTFQFQLHEATGVAEVHYLDADPLGEDWSSVGVENCNGDDGIQAAYGADAFIETAVAFVPGSGAPPVCRVNTPPVVTILTPSDGDAVFGTVDVRGTTVDDDAGDAIESFYAGYYNETQWWALPLNGTANWSGQFDATGLSGWYTLVVEAYDGSAWGSDHASFYVNASGGSLPRAGFTTPSDGDTVRGQTWVAGWASDPDGGAIDHVTLQVDDGPQLRVNGTANWSAVVNFGNHSQGWHTLRARATGPNGTGPAATIQVYVERQAPNTAPTALVWTPRDGAAVGRTVFVAGDAHDPDLGDAVVAVYVRVDDGPEFRAGGTTSWWLNLSLEGYAEGWHAISARAWDGEAYGPADTVLVYLDVPDGGVDLAVAESDVEVVRQRVVTDVAEAPNVVNEKRTIRVTVRNVGPNASAGGWVDVWLRAHSSLPLAGGTDTRHLQSTWLPAIPAGGSALVEVAWDTTRDLGDVAILVDAFHWEDADLGNNHARKDSWVRVGGINHGFLL